jgi:hypothetical protein
MVRTLVITPTFNERDNLRTFVAGVASGDPHVRVMHRPGKLGLDVRDLTKLRLDASAGRL